MNNSQELISEHKPSSVWILEGLISCFTLYSQCMRVCVRVCVLTLGPNDQDALNIGDVLFRSDAQLRASFSAKTLKEQLSAGLAERDLWPLLRKKKKKSLIYDFVCQQETDPGRVNTGSSFICMFESLEIIQANTLTQFTSMLE